MVNKFHILKEELVDRYLTWRTGKNKQQRIWEKWRNETIAVRAHTVENMFHNFKYIIEVDPEKVLEMWHPFSYHTNKEFNERYEYPHRELGDNAVWAWLRCSKDHWSHQWHIDDCFGEDHLFVATNNDQDATMIALMYS